ncbi:hypothetical protein RB653_002648 [Dictyostelium firmibasis]|uniref:Enoyl reductase (ER) domain-containing protein n=1 Tax=Dictyostelium firmibasis TaxID=79012 RepID=A0AAN7TY69_9MYCE
MLPKTNKVGLITKKGFSESFSIVNNEIPVPKDNEVLIKIDYVGLNRCDLYFSFGYYLPFEKYPNVSGFEAAGTVVEFANEELKNKSKFKVGDKVSVIYTCDHRKYGTFAEYAVFPIDCLVKNNELVSQKDISANWISFSTAYYGLKEFGQIKKGDYVIITAGSSGTSLAAIAIAKFFGAQTIVTSRNEKKKQQILDYGADHFISLDTDDLVKKTHEITNGKGANIVFDSVGGPNAQKLFESSAQFGKIVFYGNMDHSGPTPLPIIIGLKNYLTIKVLNTNEYLYQPEFNKKAVEFLNTNFNQFKSIVGKEFIGIDSLIDALKYLETGDLFGKVVVKVNTN